MTANSVVRGSHTDYQLPLFAVSVTTNCRKFAVSMTANNSDLWFNIVSDTDPLEPHLLSKTCRGVELSRDP